MPLHSNIKRRRQERIAQIKRQANSPAYTSQQTRTTRQEQTSAQQSKVAGAPTLDSKTAHKLPRDPEEAWNRRMAEWLHQSQAGNDSGDDTERTAYSARRRKVMFPAWGGFSFTSLITSIILFMVLWSLFFIELPWSSKAQQTITTLLNHRFSTEKAAEWYESVFGGTPSWIPVIQREGGEMPSQAVHAADLTSLYPPATGKIATSFAANGQGIQVLVEDDEQVNAALAGRVIFDGYTSSGRTIIIQHPSGVRTIYGWLDNLTAAENDWVEKGERIAEQVQKNEETGERVLYFSIRVGDEYVDPAEVVSFD